MADTTFVSLAMAVPLSLSGHTVMTPVITAGGIGSCTDPTRGEDCCVLLARPSELSGGRRAFRGRFRTTESPTV